MHLEINLEAVAPAHEDHAHGAMLPKSDSM